MKFTNACPICKEIIDMKLGKNTCPKCNGEFICLDEFSERIFLDSLKEYPRRRIR